MGWRPFDSMVEAIFFLFGVKPEGKKWKGGRTRYGELHLIYSGQLNNIVSLLLEVLLEQQLLKE